jgi:hyperosmotically inducible periplasmic protein
MRDSGPDSQKTSFFPLAQPKLERFLKQTWVAKNGKSQIKVMKTKTNTLSLILVAALVSGATAVITTATGCAGDRYDRSTGQYIDDKSLIARVEHALNDNPDYKFDGVNVDSFRGEVQLSGFVNTSDQKAKAYDIAKQVQGVQEVINNITVKE